MLSINGIYKAYGAVSVLEDTNLTVGKEIKVLLGINGCGKSTLLKIITGILSEDRGTIVLADQDITNLPPEKRKIGYVPQHTALFPNLTVYKNITYGIREKQNEACQKNLETIIKMLELEDHLTKKPQQLSGGYQSRVSLARALAPMPTLMLLDEPLSDVDVVIKDRLLPKFREVINYLGIPTVYVTHDPAEAEQVGDSFAAMVQGKIADANTAKEAFEMIRQSELKRLGLV